MSTEKIADRLVTLCRQGKNLQALEELYADDVVSKEMPGYPQEITKGIKAVTKKSEDWYQSVQEVHSTTISDPIVAGNHFSVKMGFDCTFKDKGRFEMEEIANFRVENGKIAEEQFFYTM